MKTTFSHFNPQPSKSHRYLKQKTNTWLLYKSKGRLNSSVRESHTRAMTSARVPTQFPLGERSLTQEDRFSEGRSRTEMEGRNVADAS